VTEESILDTCIAAVLHQKQIFGS